MATFRGNFEIIYGSNRVDETLARFYELGFSEIGIIVDKNLLNLPCFIEWKNYLQSKFIIKFISVPNLASEPTYQDLDREFELLKNSKINSLVAFGGGSVLDTAKALSIMFTNLAPAISFRGLNKVEKPGLPLAVFPSTAGTGTEMTWTASFIDLQSKVKLGINGKNMFPTLAVIEPKLIVNAPFDVVRSAALDTLVHAIESVTSRNTSFFSKTLGISATKKVIDFLPSVKRNQINLENIEMLQVAAAEAGLAMLNSSGGPASGISYPLGVHYKVPHGYAGGILLPEVMRHNIENNYLGYSEFYENSDLDGTKLLDEIENLYLEIEVPKNFKSWGFCSVKDLELIYSLTLQERKFNLELNPIDFSGLALKRILLKFIK
jgi:alcohol dehydrogenase class IV